MLVGVTGGGMIWMGFWGLGEQGIWDGNDCIGNTDSDLPIGVLHYTHCEKVFATIDVQTESGSSQTTADLARRGLRTTAGKNWSANGLPTVHKILSVCVEPKIAWQGEEVVKTSLMEVKC